MPIDEAMKKERLKRIGASDIPALFGEGYGENALANLVARRIYDMVDEPETPRGGPADVGNFQELALVPFMMRELGVDEARLVRDPYQIHESGLLAANLDGFVWPEGRDIDEAWITNRLKGTVKSYRLPAGGIVLEAKSTGKYTKWGERGSEQVPDAVLYQVTAQLMCARATEGMVGVTLPSFGRITMQTHMVYINDALVNLIMERVEWITGYIQREEMPPNETPSLPTLRMIIPRKKRTTIEAELVMDWEELREQRLEIEKAEEHAQRMLLASVADYEVADFGDDERELNASLGKGRTTYGDSPEHDVERCDNCGVGKKIGKPPRACKTRKRKEQ